MHCLILLAVPAALVLDPDQPARAERSDPVTYRVELTVTVTAPARTKLLKVWLPLPPSDAGQEVTGRDISTFPAAVEPKVAREPRFGNEFAYFEFADPQGAQVIRHRFTAKVYEQRWNVEPAKVTRVERWPAAFDLYRQPDRAVAVDDRLRKLLGEVVHEAKGPAGDLAAVMDWLGANMTYGPLPAEDRASSAKALEARRGDCSAYHGLCAAFGRAMGQPARVVYGLHLFPKASPSHCKMEAFLPPYGWVSFDVSETQKLVAMIRGSKDLDDRRKEELTRAAGDRLRRGFRDNTWLLVTRGTDFELAPPAARKAAVVRTIYAEADGVALPDPDPGDPSKREFAWMTAHRYEADRAVKYPFADWPGR